MSKNSNQTLYKTLLSYLPKRRLRFDIVTVFLFLLTISSVILFLFMYERTYSGMMGLATNFVAQSTGETVEVLSNLTKEATILVELTQHSVLDAAGLSEQNKTLFHYFYAMMQYDEKVYSVSITATNGNSISFYNLVGLYSPRYKGDPEKHLPEDVRTAMRIIFMKDNVLTAKWNYFDSSGDLVAEEEFAPPAADPRKEPLFYLTESWPRLRWRIGYDPLFETNSLLVASPMVDKERKTWAVAEIGFSLEIMSNIIGYHRVGNTGKAFVIDEHNKVLLPLPRGTASDAQDAVLIATALSYRQQKAGARNFSFKYADTIYLAHVVDFPVAPEAHWTIIGIAPFNDYFAPILKSQAQSVLVFLGILITVGFFIYFSSKHVSQPIVELADDVNKLQQLDFTERPPSESRIKEIIWLDTAIRAMRNALRAFGRYVPQGVVKTLISQKEEIALGGERRELTVFFSDIANFTTLCESLSITKLSKSLTEYFEALSKEILTTEGTIDKYIGDSIMAFWGAPQNVTDHAEKACLCALRCAKICNARKDDKHFPWTTRFGIHSGDVVVGNIGTSERMNYTAIGNVVNTSARFQSLNKEYHTTIIISESVHEQLGNRFLRRPLDFISVKGKQNKLTIYELVATIAGGLDDNLAATPEQIDFCDKFTKAYLTFHEGKMREAKELFTALAQISPDDWPTKLYLNRLSSLEKG